MKSVSRHSDVAKISIIQLSNQLNICRGKVMRAINQLEYNKHIERLKPQDHGGQAFRVILNGN